MEVHHSFTKKYILHSCTWSICPPTHNDYHRCNICQISNNIRIKFNVKAAVSKSKILVFQEACKVLARFDLSMRFLKGLPFMSDFTRFTFLMTVLQDSWTIFCRKMRYLPRPWKKILQDPCKERIFSTLG